VLILSLNSRGENLTPARQLFHATPEQIPPHLTPSGSK